MAGSAELVIFDCDGVLVDSERISVRVDVEVLGRLGWPISEAEVIERFVGRADDFMTAEIQAQIGRRLDPAWADEFLHLYRDAFARELEPVPGIVDALDRAATELGIPHMRLTSGAVHDTQRFSQIARTAMIFVQSKDGRSHTPEEFSSIDDIVAGIEVLAGALHELAY